MCVGIVVAVLGAVRIPAARTLRELLLAFLVTDLGLGVLIVYGNTLGTWANAANPGPAVNVINGGFGLGALVAPLIVYVALDVLGRPRRDRSVLDRGRRGGRSRDVLEPGRRAGDSTRAGG